MRIGEKVTEYNERRRGASSSVHVRNMYMPVRCLIAVYNSFYPDLYIRTHQNSLTSHKLRKRLA